MMPKSEAANIPEQTVSAEGRGTARPGSAGNGPAGGAAAPGSVSSVILRSTPGGQAVDGNFFEEVGGHPVFEALVRGFYEGVRDDEVLRPMYPEHDLEGAIERLTLFLEQYWGGPTTYSERRGHPRLRMRHNAYRIDADARDRWLAHMHASMVGLGLSDHQQAVLWSYLTRAAHSLMNSD